MSVTACDQETALEWAIEHLENAADEVKGRELPEAESLIKAAKEMLENMLTDVRKDAMQERYEEM